MKKLLLILGVSSFGLTMAADGLSVKGLHVSGSASSSQKNSMAQFDGKYLVRGGSFSKKSKATIKAPNTLRALDLQGKNVDQRESKVRPKLVRQYTTHGLPPKEQVKFYTGPGVRSDLNLLVPDRVHANYTGKRRVFKIEPVLLEEKESNCCCCSSIFEQVAGLLSYLVPEAVEKELHE